MQSLNDYIDGLPIMSTHEHHITFEDAAHHVTGPDALGCLFQRGYVAWAHRGFSDRAARGRFLDMIAGNSYFVWYEKALDCLFDFGGEITEANWDSISEKVEAAFATTGFQEDVWRSKCKYSKAILDAYWSPGCANDRYDLYAPTFRVNSFLYGYHEDAEDHNGNNAQNLYGSCASLDEYLDMADRVIGEMKARGCVALKSAAAYDRTLDFTPGSRRVAEKVFARSPHDVSPEELKAFGNHVFDHICSLAAKHDLPLQNHTGLGKLSGSDPMNLIPMIEKHPETKFVLFHGGYPWTEQIAGLTHNYGNVYADMCWLPAICTSAAERMLHSLIEAAQDSSRITWGGDCWLITESYAHSLAARHVVKRVLSEKVSDGYLTEARARRLAERILSVNAKELYKV